MTVKELIEKLRESECPDDAVVCISGSDYESESWLDGVERIWIIPPEKHLSSASSFKGRTIVFFANEHNLPPI